MLGEGGEGAEEEVEGVLEEDGQVRDGGGAGEGRGEGFDGGPGDVDVEQEEERAEADDGRLWMWTCQWLFGSWVGTKESFRECIRRIGRRPGRGG